MQCGHFKERCKSGQIEDDPFTNNGGAKHLSNRHIRLTIRYVHCLSDKNASISKHAIKYDYLGRQSIHMVIYIHPDFDDTEITQLDSLDPPGMSSSHDPTSSLFQNPGYFECTPDPDRRATLARQN
jgi:hypothetical protein